MSTIDRALQDLGAQHRESPALSVPDALAAILVASVFVDGALNVDESARVESTLSTSRLFRDTNIESIERAIALLNDRGTEAVLAASASALPPTLHATAFALAVDLVLCDGRIESGEKAYIDSLQAALGVDEATALKIVEVMVIRNRA